ncbi:hypothetical protein [Bosea sp. NBC_00550]|uniref:hypothetical protein n=1 Tax=Bosea sp. NBC_00550 TaxID=2969621 RepID=UPI00222E4027|nr:hypothetical protein [Bosea sp. NBC_00550]UZF91272.1 hypothetical protein NWE53_19385 [Bosea sp. NBC_00550]
MTRRDYWITDPVLSALLRYRASVIGGSWRSRGLPIATFSDQMHPSPASKKRGRQHVTTRLMLSASAAGAVWISASSAQAQLCPVINSTVVRSGNGQCTIANSTLIGSDFTFPYPFPTVAASDGAQITTNTNNVTIAPQNGGTIGVLAQTTGTITLGPGSTIGGNFTTAALAQTGGQIISSLDRPSIAHRATESRP